MLLTIDNNSTERKHVRDVTNKRSAALWRNSPALKQSKVNDRVTPWLWKNCFTSFEFYIKRKGFFANVVHC